VLNALKAKDTQALYALRGRSSRWHVGDFDWVALDGAVGPLPMTLIDYVGPVIVRDPAPAAPWRRLLAIVGAYP